MDLRASDSRPNWIFAIATVLWAVVAAIAVRLAAFSLVPLLGGPRALHWFAATPGGLALSAATIQLTMGLVVVARAGLEPVLWRKLREDCRRRPSRAGWSLLLIVGLGPLANAAGVLLARALGQDLGSMQQVAALIRRATLLELCALGLVLTLLPALVEESLFRGLVQRSLAGARVSVVLVAQAVAFGCFHLDLAQGVATAILGLGFGLIAQLTGSLVGAMVAHAGYNLMVLLSQRTLGLWNETWQAQLLEVTLGALLSAWAARRLIALRVTMPEEAK